MNAVRRPSRQIVAAGTKWVVVAIALALVFAAYLNPAIMIALDGFWAMCVGALR